MRTGVWNRTSFQGTKTLPFEATLADGPGYGSIFVYDMAASPDAPTFSGQGFRKTEIDALEAARKTRGMTVTITDCDGETYTGYVVSISYNPIEVGADDWYDVSQMQLFLT